MREPIEVVYEHGVFRPLSALPDRFQEHEHLTITIESANQADRWLDDADPTVSLEAVREMLAKVPGTLAQLIHAER